MAWFKGKSKGNQSCFLPKFFLETQMILAVFSERKSGWGGIRAILSQRRICRNAAKVGMSQCQRSRHVFGLSLEQTIVTIVINICLTFVRGSNFGTNPWGPVLENSWFHTAHAKPRKIRALLCFTPSFVLSEKTHWLIWPPWPWENFTAGTITRIDKAPGSAWSWCIMQTESFRNFGTDQFPGFGWVETGKP